MGLSPPPTPTFLLLIPLFSHLSSYPPPHLLLSLPRCLVGPGGFLVNRYGYSPMALEWDLWLDPTLPAEISNANVDHGSSSLLAYQVRGT